MCNHCTHDKAVESLLRQRRYCPAACALQLVCTLLHVFLQQPRAEGLAGAVCWLHSKGQPLQHAPHPHPTQVSSQAPTLSGLCCAVLCLLMLFGQCGAPALWWPWSPTLLRSSQRRNSWSSSCPATWQHLLHPAQWTQTPAYQPPLSPLPAPCPWTCLPHWRQLLSQPSKHPPHQRPHLLQTTVPAPLLLLRVLVTARPQLAIVQMRARVQRCRQPQQQEQRVPCRWLGCSCCRCRGVMMLMQGVTAPGRDPGQGRAGHRRSLAPLAGRPRDRPVVAPAHPWVAEGSDGCRERWGSSELP